MAAIIGSIEVILSSNVDAYNSAMRSAATTTEQHTARMDRAVKSTAGSVNSLGRSLSTMNVEAFRSLSYSALHASDSTERLRMSMLAVMSLAGGFAGAFAIKGLTETADTYTNIQNRLRVITDNTQHRVELERELFNSAQRTRTSIEETAKLYSRMDLAIGEHLSTAEKMRFVETVQKSFAVSGMTQSEISSNVLEITHGIDSGRIQAKTLRPLLMENVALGKELAKILAGGDLSRLREMGEEGEITSEKFVRAIIQAGDTIDKQFTRVVPTVSSSLTILNNAWMRYIGMQNESSGASQMLSRGIVSLADNMQTLGDHALQVGTILASLFIGRGVARRTVSGGGAIADSVRGMIADRRSDLDAARAAALRAQEERAMAIVAAEQASQRSSTLRSAPAFMAAAPSAKAAWEKQQATVDSIKTAIAEADARQMAALEKRAALESTVATASEGALRKQAAANAALAAEKERILLIDQQIAAAEARMNSAGGAVSRGQMSKFYGAWANVSDQRAAFAAAEQNLARAQRLEEGIRARLTNAPDRMKGMQEANLRANLDAQKQFADEKLALGRSLQKAENEFASVQQGILASQQKAQQSATAAYLAEVTRREEAMARLSASTEKAAAAQMAVDASVLRNHQALMAQMNRIDAEAAAARAAGNTARGALTPATAQLGATRAAVNASAQSTVVGAIEAEAAAIAKANQAHFSYAQAAGQVATAQARLSASSIAMTAIWNGLSSAGAGLLGFLGGPWGAAITGAVVALGLWEAAEMRAAAREREHKTAVEELTVAVAKYNDAVRNGTGGFNSSQFADMAVAASKTKEALAAVEASLRANVMASRQAEFALTDMGALATGGSGIAGLSSIFDGLPPKIRETAQQVLEGKARFDELKTAVEELIAQNPGIAAQAAEVLKLARAGATAQNALNGAAQAARNLATAMSAAEVSKLSALNEFVPHEQTDAEKEAQKWAVAIERRKKYADMKEAGDTSGLARQKMYDEASDKGMRLDKERIAVIDAVAAAEARAEEAEKERNKKGKTAKPKKTAEQKQDESITNYEQRADVAMLDKLSQKLVQAAQSAKFSKEEIEKLIATLRVGGELTGLSENMQRLVEAEKKLEDAKWARDKIESAKTEAEKYREEVERLQRALGEGILSDKQADQLKKAVREDDPAFKRLQEDVGKMMEPIKGDLERYLDGDHKAFEKFWQQMRSTAIKAALDPIWKSISKMISDSIGSMLGLGGGGGGGFLSMIFGGMFGGGGGGGGVPLGGLFHSGGTVGAGGPPNGFRAVSPGTFSGAMRYHTGLSASEFPAILQHGERVLTQSQAARTDGVIAGLAAAAGAGRAGQSIAVHNYAAGVDVTPQITPEGVIFIVKSMIEQNNRGLPSLMQQQSKRT